MSPPQPLIILKLNIMLNFTVAIPTYNGAARLPDLLRKLQSQIHIENLTWQILVVDNNSKDHTAQVIKEFPNNFPGDCTIKYDFEEQQGAAFARQKAITLAKSDWVAFLDDDVIPANDWVINAYQFSQKYPQAGAFGGQIHGNFEVDPPENFHRIKSFLAIRERGEKPNLYDPDNLSLPPSAAWVVNRQAWLDNVPEEPTLGGRVKGSMVQGDDYEPLLHMHRAGWKIWYNPTMHVHHQIPRQRLEKNYLIALSRGCGLCVCKLRLINTKIWQKPIIITRIWLGNFKRLLLHLYKYRGQVKTDLVAACEMEFLLGCLASPFYL